MSYLFRYIGQVLGVAFSSAILQSVLQRDLSRTITGVDAKEVSPPSRLTLLTYLSAVPLPLPLLLRSITSCRFALRIHCVPSPCIDSRRSTYRLGPLRWFLVLRRASHHACVSFCDGQGLVRVVNLAKPVHRTVVVPPCCR